MPRPVRTDEEWTTDFIARIRHDQSGCWVWMGYIGTQGYGQASLRRRDEYVHRLSHELWVGPIPDGYDVDHLCHNRDVACEGGITCLHRRCVNPDHLEAISKKENRRRQRNVIEQMNRTHCPQGHPYDDENTISVRGNGRNCRQCRLDYTKSHKRQCRSERDTSILDTVLRCTNRECHEGDHQVIMNDMVVEYWPRRLGLDTDG